MLAVSVPNVYARVKTDLKAAAVDVGHPAVAV